MFGLAETMSARSVVSASWSWIGVVVVVASVALIVTLLHRGERAHFCLLVLLLAGFLVTVEGIRLHTDQSMMKRDDFGI